MSSLTRVDKKEGDIGSFLDALAEKKLECSLHCTTRIH